MKNLMTKLNILLFLSVIACGSEEKPKTTHAPGGGSITVEATMNNSIVINIAEASDEGTAVENLTYAAYYTDGVMPEDIGAIINRQHLAVVGWHKLGHGSYLDWKQIKTTR